MCVHLCACFIFILYFYFFSSPLQKKKKLKKNKIKKIVYDKYFLWHIRFLIYMTTFAMRQIVSLIMYSSIMFLLFPIYVSFMLSV